MGLDKIYIDWKIKQIESIEKLHTYDNDFTELHAKRY